MTTQREDGLNAMNRYIFLKKEGNRHHSTISFNVNDLLVNPYTGRKLKNKSLTFDGDYHTCVAVMILHHHYVATHLRNKFKY